MDGRNVSSCRGKAKQGEVRPYPSKEEKLAKKIISVRGERKRHRRVRGQSRIALISDQGGKGRGRPNGGRRMEVGETSFQGRLQGGGEGSIHKKGKTLTIA